MRESPLIGLGRCGQSPWLDFIDRTLLGSGRLAELIERFGISGVTSNPAIFEKAIVRGSAYDAEIARLAAAGMPPSGIYEALVIADIQSAADILADVYRETRGRDGYVSLEVSPHLAHDTAGTVAEARRFWSLVGRPNVMIKVPGTGAGLPAIRELISAGINVNVTLLFSLARYREIIDAWLQGLEAARDAGHPIDRIASVASFFLSRIDTAVDRRLDNIVAGAGPGAREALRLKGRIAIASARRAYVAYQDARHSDRFASLARHGARPQRLLWASTGTKNPAYSDVKYVEPLIGPDTVSTMPLDTLEAYDDHGQPVARLSRDAEDARADLAALKEFGIDLRAVTDSLVTEGIRKFAEPYDGTRRALQRAFPV